MTTFVFQLCTLNCEQEVFDAHITTHMVQRRAGGAGEAATLGFFGFAQAARDPAKTLTSEELNSTTQGEEAMKSRNSRWIKLMGIGAFSAVLLSSGAGPAAAVTTCKPYFYQVTPSGPATPRLCISYDPFIGRFDEALAWCR